MTQLNQSSMERQSFKREFTRMKSALGSGRRSLCEQQKAKDRAEPRGDGDFDPKRWLLTQPNEADGTENDQGRHEFVSQGYGTIALPILNEGSEFFVFVNPFVPVRRRSRKTPAGQQNEGSGGEKRQNEPRKTQTQRKQADRLEATSAQTRDFTRGNGCVRRMRRGGFGGLRIGQSEAP